jgi:hypothetical protein
MHRLFLVLVFLGCGGNSPSVDNVPYDASDIEAPTVPDCPVGDASPNGIYSTIDVVPGKRPCGAIQGTCGVTTRLPCDQGRGVDATLRWICSCVGGQVVCDAFPLDGLGCHD